MNKAAKALSGNFSARTYEEATLNGKRFAYDGTTLGLTLAALNAGARVGDTITAHLVFGPRNYTLSAAGGGNRTPNGVWASRVFA